MNEFVNGEDEKKSQDGEKTVILQRKKRYIAVTDDDGQIIGYFPLKDKNLGKDWVAMYQSALLTLAKWNLPNEQYRVMLALLSKVDFDNYLTVSQQAIANELKMKQPHIARAIKGLCERDIIVEGPRAGLNKTYRLNPHIAHKGKNRSESILDFETALGKKRKAILDDENFDD